MARIAPWMVGVKEREREQAKAEKASRVYGVFMHSEGDGYVVRTGEKQADGSYYWPMPYSHDTPAAVSKSEKLANKHADKLNGR